MYCVELDAGLCCCVHGLSGQRNRSGGFKCPKRSAEALTEIPAGKKIQQSVFCDACNVDKGKCFGCSDIFRSDNGFDVAF